MEIIIIIIDKIPITIYTPANMKKLLKKDLVLHALDLQGFIELFECGKLLKENEELKQEKEKLRLEVSEQQDYIDTETVRTAFECAECDELKEENEKLKKKNEDMEDFIVMTKHLRTCLSEKNKELDLLMEKYMELKD